MALIKWLNFWQQSEIVGSTISVEHLLDDGIILDYVMFNVPFYVYEN